MCFSTMDAPSATAMAEERASVVWSEKPTTQSKAVFRVTTPAKVYVLSAAPDTGLRSEAARQFQASVRLEVPDGRLDIIEAAVSRG